MDVLIVYHYFALYREPIFKELLMSKKMNIFLAGDKEANNDIKLVSEASELYVQGNFIRLNNVWGKGKYLWQVGVLSAVLKKKWKAVILLGDPNFISTWAVLLLSKFLPVKTYLWTHGFVMRGGGAQRLLKKFMYSLSDGVFLYGNTSKKELIEIGIGAEKLHVIYNSLNYFSQCELRNKISKNNILSTRKKLCTDGMFQLVFIGRLTFHKKLDILIKSLSLLMEKENDFALVFIGDGEAKESLENLAVSLGVSESVKFIGSIYAEEDIAPILMCSDVCVSPGEVGLTAMHAMGYGLPVITHSNDCAQMPEFEVVKPGITGELFVQDDVFSLVDAIGRVHENGSKFYRDNCIDIIESDYNPIVQAKRIGDVLNGNS
jgi:glycosyltransferase involved in cell wall biosynthesis